MKESNVASSSDGVGRLAREGPGRSWFWLCGHRAPVTAAPATVVALATVRLLSFVLSGGCAAASHGSCDQHLLVTKETGRLFIFLSTSQASRPVK